MRRLTELISISYNNQLVSIQQIGPKDYNYYQPSGSFLEIQYQIIYKDDKFEKKFLSLDDLGQLLTENSLSLRDMIIVMKEKFSRAISTFLELGRVVNNHEIYHSLKAKYGIHGLSSLAPSIMADQLVFVTYSPTLNNLNPPLLKIHLSIEGLHCEKSVLKLPLL